MYNSQLWELSLLRLNQLNYFEALKPEQDSEVHQNVADNSVDINLKVKEKGKELDWPEWRPERTDGAFVGLKYETNNFLGLGESLTLSASLGTYQKNATIGFTEPYVFDKPIQTGFTAYDRNFKYNQASTDEHLVHRGGHGDRGVSECAAELYAVEQGHHGLGRLRGAGAVPALRADLPVGRLDHHYLSPPPPDYFYESDFRSVSGTNAVHGIMTSKLVPSFSKSTIDSPLRPHRGSSYFVGMDIAGLGGNVAYLRPIGEYKKFIPMKGFHANKQGLQTLGFRVQGSFITGFAGKTAPPFERFFQGGDTDLRGFDIRTASPTALINDQVAVPLTNPDGVPVPKDPNNALAGNYTINVPIQRLVYPGGDTSIVGNLEYRIPIAGPVTLALFVDSGMNMAIGESQLRLAGQQVNESDTAQFGCPAYDPGLPQLRGNRVAEVPPVHSSAAPHQLCAAGVDRRGNADSVADGERAVPALLRLQSLPGRYHRSAVRSDHAEYVPGGRSWRVHLSEYSCDL